MLLWHKYIEGPEGHIIRNYSEPYVLLWGPRLQLPASGSRRSEWREPQPQRPRARGRPGFGFFDHLSDNPFLKIMVLFWVPEISQCLTAGVRDIELRELKLAHGTTCSKLYRRPAVTEASRELLQTSPPRLTRHGSHFGQAGLHCFTDLRALAENAWTRSAAYTSCFAWGFQTTSQEVSMHSAHENIALCFSESCSTGDPFSIGSSLFVMSSSIENGAIHFVSC